VIFESPFTCTASDGPGGFGVVGSSSRGGLLPGDLRSLGAGGSAARRQSPLANGKLALAAG
jgi:hypothetical protein